MARQANLLPKYGVSMVKGQLARRRRAIADLADVACVDVDVAMRVLMWRQRPARQEGEALPRASWWAKI